MMDIDIDILEDEMPFLKADHEIVKLENEKVKEEACKMKNDFLMLKQKIICTDSLIRKVQEKQYEHQIVARKYLEMAKLVERFKIECEIHTKELQEMLISYRPLKEEKEAFQKLCKEQEAEIEQLRYSVQASQVVQNQLFQANTNLEMKVSTLTRENKELCFKVNKMEKMEKRKVVKEDKPKDLRPRKLSSTTEPLPTETLATTFDPLSSPPSASANISKIELNCDLNTTSNEDSDESEMDSFVNKTTIDIETQSSVLVNDLVSSCIDKNPIKTNIPPVCSNDEISKRGTSCVRNNKITKMKKQNRKGWVSDGPFSNVVSSRKSPKNYNKTRSKSVERTSTLNWDQIKVKNYSSNGRPAAPRNRSCNVPINSGSDVDVVNRITLGKGECYKSLSEGTIGSNYKKYQVSKTCKKIKNIRSEVGIEFYSQEAIVQKRRRCPNRNLYRKAINSKLGDLKKNVSNDKTPSLSKIHQSETFNSGQLSSSESSRFKISRREYIELMHDLELSSEDDNDNLNREIDSKVSCISGLQDMSSNETVLYDVQCSHNVSPTTDLQDMSSNETVLYDVQMNQKINLTTDLLDMSSQQTVSYDLDDKTSENVEPGSTRHFTENFLEKTAFLNHKSRIDFGTRGDFEVTSTQKSRDDKYEMLLEDLYISSDDDHGLDVEHEVCVSDLNSKTDNLHVSSMVSSTNIVNAANSKQLRKTKKDGSIKKEASIKRKRKKREKSLERICTNKSSNKKFRKIGAKNVNNYLKIGVSENDKPCLEDFEKLSLDEILSLVCVSKPLPSLSEMKKIFDSGKTSNYEKVQVVSSMQEFPRSSSQRTPVANESQHNCQENISKRVTVQSLIQNVNARYLYKSLLRTVKSHTLPMSKFLDSTRNSNLIISEFVKILIRVCLSINCDLREAYKNREILYSYPWFPVPVEKLVEIFFLWNNPGISSKTLKEEFLEKSLSIISKHQPNTKLRIHPETPSKKFPGKFNKSSISALCYLVVALFRNQGDVESVRMLLFEVIRNSPTSENVSTVIMAICAVWPQSLLSNSLPPSAIQQVLHHYVSQAAIQNDKISHCIKHIFGWEVSNRSADELSSSLLKQAETFLNQRIVSQDDVNKVIWETQTSLELLCRREGWQWTCHSMVSISLWSVLNTWATQPNKFNEHFIRLVIDLLGICSKLYLKVFDPNNLTNILGNLTALVQETSVSMKIREAAFRSIIRLSASSIPDAVRPFLRSKNLLEQDTTELLDQFNLLKC